AQMRTACSGGLWPATPVLPFAAPFGDPTTSSLQGQGSPVTLQGLVPASYAFAGGCSCDAPNTTPCVCSVNSQGQRSLEPCTTAGNPRCVPGFVAWRTSLPCGGAAVCTSFTQTAGTNLHSYSCTVSGVPTTLTCNINAWVDLAGFLAGNTGMTFNLDAAASNVGMSLRQVTNPTGS